MTNVKQIYRIINDDPRGPRCACHDESILHVLMDCDFVKGIWKAAYENNLHFWNFGLIDWKILNLKGEYAWQNEWWSGMFRVRLEEIW